MKEIEKLLQEYKIRFRDTERIKDRENKPEYLPTVSYFGNVFNQFGQVRFGDTKGWATADLKEAPDKWVVEKDESNPIWEEFLEMYKRYDHPVWEYNYIAVYSDVIAAQGFDELIDSVGHQYLTLLQWKHFFGKPEIKVGDYGFFWSGYKSDYAIGLLTSISEHFIPYKMNHYKSFPNFHPIDITKPLDEQIDEFLNK